MLHDVFSYVSVLYLPTSEPGITTDFVSVYTILAYMYSYLYLTLGLDTIITLYLRVNLLHIFKSILL